MARGFTIAELAIVVAIVALLLGGMMMTLSAQSERRDQQETLQRINAAVEAIHGFAMVNRRLPCPARYVSSASNSQGQESFCPGASGTCVGTETTTVQAHGNCSDYYSGYLPAASLGVTPVDSAGFAVDAWGNRIRYAVASLITGCTGSSATPHFTSQANLRANGISCKPGDLDICTVAQASAATACSSTAVRVVTSNTVAFLVYSTGKNGALPGQGLDEIENTDGDRVFVSRTPGTSDTAGGAYDDIMVIVPAAVFYSKMVSAGVLP